MELVSMWESKNVALAYLEWLRAGISYYLQGIHLMEQDKSLLMKDWVGQVYLTDTLQKLKVWPFGAQLMYNLSLM